MKYKKTSNSSVIKTFGKKSLIRVNGENVNVSVNGKHKH